MTKQHDARELPDGRDRELAEVARNIRRAIESPLKPMVPRVAPHDDRQRDAYYSSWGPIGTEDSHSQTQAMEQRFARHNIP
jgi:hypothetical protein